jgi:ABC-type uncharacterized transport system permease subunit
MNILRRVWFVCLSLALASASALAQQPGQDFQPVTGPVTEQIPAAPLVISSYAFFLVLLFVYLWTIWRRIGKVEADMRALERRQPERGPHR